MIPQQFFDHYGIHRNPFSDEDAQTDPVFKDYCIDSNYHPAWDKVFGDPREPSTSIVFGEKGAGKTAMRMQIVRRLEEHNQKRPDSRNFIVQYDDFNPFLEQFRTRFPQRWKPEKALERWGLWDHMDSLLYLATTEAVDQVLEAKHVRRDSGSRIRPEALADLDRYQARDFLLLAACYDRSTGEAQYKRWTRLAGKLGYALWPSWIPTAVGAAWSIVALVLVILAFSYGYFAPLKESIWYLLFGLLGIVLFVAAGWIWQGIIEWKAWRTAKAVMRSVRVGKYDPSALRRMFASLPQAEIRKQPLPGADRNDDRYAMLEKLQSVLRTLGFPGIVVIMDRVDEPEMINGKPERMKAFVWPALDNKLLRHAGLGLKMMLPKELSPFLEREDREFYQRARLDKQNMIPSFYWTGEALYDVADARLRACAADGKQVTLSDLFDERMSRERLVESLRSLRVPRHMFKFLFRMLETHCKQYTADQPRWKIAPETFESELRLFARDLDNYDRGLGTG